MRLRACFCEMTLLHGFGRAAGLKIDRSARARARRAKPDLTSLTIVHWRAMFVTELRRIHSAQATFVAFVRSPSDLRVSHVLQTLKQRPQRAAFQK